MTADQPQMTVDQLNKALDQGWRFCGNGPDALFLLPPREDKARRNAAVFKKFTLVVPGWLSRWTKTPLIGDTPKNEGSWDTTLEARVEDDGELRIYDSHGDEVETSDA